MDDACACGYPTAPGHHGHIYCWFTDDDWTGDIHALFGAMCETGAPCSLTTLEEAAETIADLRG